MANESTYSLISSILNPVRDAAMLYAQKRLFMKDVSMMKDERTGLVPRDNSEYASGTVFKNLAEGANGLSNLQTFNRSQIASITPATYKAFYQLTDERLASEDVTDAFLDLAMKVTYETNLQIELDLLTSMASFTAGTIGGAGSVLSWTMIYKARAILSAAGVPPPYNVVLHEYSYLQLAVAANIAGLANPGPLKIRDDIQSDYYVGSTADMDIFTTGVLTAGTSVKQGIFNKMAILYDQRKPFGLETMNRPDLTSVVVTGQEYAGCGLYRPAWGVTIVSDASTPS